MFATIPSCFTITGIGRGTVCSFLTTTSATGAGRLSSSLSTITILLRRRLSTALLLSISAVAAADVRFIAEFSLNRHNTYYYNTKLLNNTFNNKLLPLFFAILFLFGLLSSSSITSSSTIKSTKDPVESLRLS